MNGGGWIKLYRQLQECPMWYSERFSKGQAWVDLLLLANHRDKRVLFNGEMITIKRGQYLTSTVKLAEKWGWNRKTVSSYLKGLENEQMITKKTDNKKTLITIENYGVYQGAEDTDGQQAGQENGQENGQQITQLTDSRTDTNKNIKNIKNNIYVQNDAEKDKIKADFEIIYSSYPQKVGKAKGFDYYKGWLVGRVISGDKIKLTNRQIWDAIDKYKKEQEAKETELCYYKNFDTFMNKAILDYLGMKNER